VPVPVVGLKVVASPRWRYVLVYCLLGAKYYGYLVLPPSMELKVIPLGSMSLADATPPD